MNSQVLVRSFASRERLMSQRRVYWGQWDDTGEKKKRFNSHFFPLSQLFTSFLPLCSVVAVISS